MLSLIKYRDYFIFLSKLDRNFLSKQDALRIQREASLFVVSVFVLLTSHAFSRISFQPSMLSNVAPKATYNAICLEKTKTNGQSQTISFM
jgi:hypothetical protein